MRDGITLKKAGHPTVVFVHDKFEWAARVQAKAMGEPDLNIYVYPQYRPGASDEEEAAKAAKAFEEFPAMLVHQPQPSGARGDRGRS
ncbi:MAG: hypothetical protein HYX89_06290 [Chloroflexi bacterium]|nr:hypothetical protein [Chloroflexota bacterium]